MRLSQSAPVPELLYLVHGDPGELAEALSQMRAADVADALRELPPDAAAKVMAALPFDLAVQVFDEPELEGHRCGIIQQMGERAAAPLMDAMSGDQRADLFRELPETERPRFLKVLDDDSRRALGLLLEFPPETAGGIMTTEFVSVPATWTVERVLAHVREVGKAKETIYAIYVLDPATQALVKSVSLRDLMLADRATLVSDIGTRRQPITVTTLMDREEVARLISKYNLLAVPVVDDAKRVIGIVTVDDVIDAIVREQTEDVQKFGGMEALDEPYTEISFLRMLKKRAGWLCALFLGEMLTATAMGHFEGEIAKAVGPLAVHSAHHQLRRQLGLAGDVADHPRLGPRRSENRRLVANRPSRASGRTRARSDPRRHRRHSNRALAEGRLVRLRSAFGAHRGDRRRGPGRGRHLRIARRIDVALPSQAARLRSRQRVGSIRRDAGRRHRTDYLFQCRLCHSARYAPLIGHLHSATQCHQTPFVRRSWF